MFSLKERLFVVNETPPTLRLPLIPASKLCNVPFVTTSPELPTAVFPRSKVMTPAPLIFAELWPVTLNVFVDAV
jgi:hypothetical protein